jgi:hypothetical protein
MKKYALLSFLVALILVATMLPTGLLSASPGNLVRNGDFTYGATDWYSWGTVDYTSGDALLSGSYSFISQEIGTTNKNLSFSCDVDLLTFGENGGIIIDFLDSSGSLGRVDYYLRDLSLGLNNISDKLNDKFYAQNGYGIPDYQYLVLLPYLLEPAVARFDNFIINAPEISSNEKIFEPEPWVRNREMTCFQIWVNEDNNFEFVFWWEYYNNNWVKIYDMDGNEAFSIDMEKGNAHFIADLPDGFYTVKTFHNGFETPIQEFLIGKP